MVKSLATSLAAKPVPVTAIAVPLGPESGEMLTVGAAAEANETSGAAIEMIRRAVSIATVDLLNFLKLLMFLFSPIC
jgi:hypothetical protein